MGTKELLGSSSEASASFSEVSFGLAASFTFLSFYSQSGLRPQPQLWLHNQR